MVVSVRSLAPSRERAWAGQGRRRRAAQSLPDLSHGNAAVGLERIDQITYFAPQSAAGIARIERSHGFWVLVLGAAFSVPGQTPSSRGRKMGAKRWGREAGSNSFFCHHFFARKSLTPVSLGVGVLPATQPWLEDV